MMPSQTLLYYVGVVTTITMFLYLLVRLGIWLKILAAGMNHPLRIEDSQEIKTPHPPAEKQEVIENSKSLEEILARFFEKPMASPTLDKAHSMLEKNQAILGAIHDELVHQGKIHEDAAGYLLEVTKQLRRLNRKFSGEAFDDVTDERAQEIERINDLMDRTGIGRQEATERVRSERTYTRDSLGIGDRRR